MVARLQSENPHNSAKAGILRGKLRAAVTKLMRQHLNAHRRYSRSHLRQILLGENVTVAVWDEIYTDLPATICMLETDQSFVMALPAIELTAKHLQNIVAWGCCKYLLQLNLLSCRFMQIACMALGEGELLLTDRPGLSRGLHNSLTRAMTSVLCSAGHLMITTGTCSHL